MKKNVLDASVSYYQTPEVEVIEVVVEQGFAGSPDDEQLENPGQGGVI